MIKSMTGFGRSAYEDTQVQIGVEFKTLNSKFLDLSLRLPRIFSEREIELRNLISEKLERGKVSVSIEYLRHGENTIRQTYNEALFVSYYAELKKLADKVVAPYGELFQLALTSPDVINTPLAEGSSDEEWNKVKKCILESIQLCDGYRVAEGKVLEKMLKECCGIISNELKAVIEQDPKRVQRIRERLKNNVQNFFGEEGYDLNRLEQEIIFYIEKLDINEEKVRLNAHLNYFLQAVSDTQSNGKKLGFIAQEIGREINTIGSKANDADIQKHVVVMKEELEKIKEQLNNVL
jgi:uncharacterized protein (TIGR00255 family)